MLVSYASQELKVQRDKLKKYQKKVRMGHSSQQNFQMVISVPFQVGIQLGKERDLAKQLLKDGKRE